MENLVPVPTQERLLARLKENPELARWATELLQRETSLKVEKSKAIPDVTGGYYNYRKLPVDAFPDVSPVLVQIFVETEGLAPEEVEKYVTYPIEVAMNGLPKLEQIRSVSNFGLSVVNLYFEDEMDIYPAASKRRSTNWRPLRKSSARARSRGRTTNGSSQCSATCADATSVLSSPMGREPLSRASNCRPATWCNGADSSSCSKMQTNATPSSSRSRCSSSSTLTLLVIPALYKWFANNPNPENEKPGEQTNEGNQSLHQTPKKSSRAS